jgi:hypothetical protein
MIDNSTETNETADDGRPALLLRGFAPLVFLVALLIAAILLVPSIAPERYVSRPKPSPTSTTATSAVTPP